MFIRFSMGIAWRNASLTGAGSPGLFAASVGFGLVRYFARSLTPGKSIRSVAANIAIDGEGAPQR
ncbi:hypothetical protein [Hoeflea sp.]|uniref:hypothetical protein n=1 Tax=Hoeflea sp. TaxID=1940281 RepID=UPI003A8F8634